MVPIWSDPVSMDYHLKQWNEPKYSTTYFHSFIEHELKNSSNVIDLGCGTGASTYYLAERSIGSDENKRVLPALILAKDRFSSLSWSDTMVCTRRP